MLQNNHIREYGALLRRMPNAYAVLEGSPTYYRIHGTVLFYQTAGGVVVAAEVSGLPSPSGKCESPIFGFHIHEGTTCQGNEMDPFADAMLHYNPNGCLHPYHAGDLPPLFGVRGSAFSVFLTGRFAVREIIGKTVIIHASPDDFTTQPSGNSGTKIACGEIVDIRNMQKQPR